MSDSWSIIPFHLAVNKKKKKSLLRCPMVVYSVYVPMERSIRYLGKVDTGHSYDFSSWSFSACIKFFFPILEHA